MTPSLRTPDTSLVIARVKQNDSLHGKAVSYLASIPPKDVRILQEVFLEAQAVLQKKSAVAMIEIIRTVEAYASEGQINPRDLNRNDIRPIIRKTIERVGPRSEGFFNSIARHMVTSFEMGNNPFLSMPDLTNAISRNDIEKMQEIFYLMKHGNSLLTADGEEAMITKLEIEEKLLRSDGAFFSKEKNNRDRRIASELLVVCRNHHGGIEFAIFDQDFFAAMKRILARPEFYEFSEERLTCVLPR
jgi:hypothetical protein